jgi:CRISPR-associated endonuclease/helicase Cas3
LDDHPEFAQVAKTVADRLRLPVLSLPLTKERFWGFSDEKARIQPGGFDLEQHRERLKDRRLQPFKVALGKDEGRRRLLWAVRAALIAADAVGSGLPRVGEKDMLPWITAAFAQVCDDTFICKEIINQRIAELQRKNKWEKWSEFQLQCDTLPSRALLLAPCGSGKTLAAWRWIAARLKERPAARVLFLYPTRATAKEGFRDYVSWAPEAAAALMSGTADYDLQGMFDNPDDPRHENRYETEHRLFSLGFWTRRVFSATVDQFLAFLQYGYSPMCMLPVLADSVVVIDEVHSYDRNMFAALKDFLKHFDVPVLCMTATLPEDRQRELKECGVTIYDEKPGELEKIAAAPRYRVRRTTAAYVPGRVRAALARGQRVLWVVNQVRRAQVAAIKMASDFRRESGQETLHAAPGISLFCYHSRFKLSDRVNRHNDVVEGFRDGCPPALAITTQVCEMSLDMDADLLVTEDCPITSLIQRMGRCNRARLPRSLDRSGEVLVYTPESPEPYDKAALTGLSEFMDRLCVQESVNQAELEQALQDSPSPPVQGDPLCSFLNSGPYAMAGEEDFRDIEEFTRPAILRGEVSQFVSVDKVKQAGFIIPVPRKLSDPPDEPRGALPPYLRVAPDAHYHKALGFCDKPLSGM